MSKIEKYVSALLTGEPLELVPNSRTEAYLKACCEGCGCNGLPAPVTDIDNLLYLLAEKMAGSGSGITYEKAEGVYF